jgi:hypothetical protein
VTAPTPSGAALDALRETDIAEMRSAAQEYEDSAHACDTPALRPYRRIRNLRAIALRDGADRYAALLTEHTALRAERDSQQRIAIAAMTEVAALSTRLAVAGEERQQKQGWTKNDQLQGQEHAARDATGDAFGLPALIEFLTEQATLAQLHEDREGLIRYGAWIGEVERLLSDHTRAADRTVRRLAALRAAAREFLEASSAIHEESSDCIAEMGRRHVRMQKAEKALREAIR